MPDSGSVRAGRAYVEVFTKDSLTRGLDQIGRKFKAWGQALTASGMKVFAAGAAMAAPLLGAADAFAKMGAEMQIASERTGVSVEMLSKLKYAAEQNGVPFEALETAAARLSKTLLTASEGSQQTVHALQMLGLNVADLAKLSPDQQFIRIAEALSKVQSPTLKSALAMELFGRAGAELLPLMNGGSQGMAALMKRAEDLGLVMSGTDAKAAHEFEQRLSDLWASVKMGVFTIGGSLAPVLRSVTLAITNGVKSVREFIAQHQGLFVAALLVAGGIAGMGAAMVALGVTLSMIGVAMSGIVAAMGAVSAVFAAAVSPVGLVVAAIGAGVYALIRFTSVGSTVGKFLSDVFDSIKDDALQAFGGIRDALAAGNWSLAAKILWTAIELEASKGIAKAKLLWAQFKSAVSRTWNDIGTDILSATYKASEGFLKIWTRTLHAWRSTVQTVAGWIQKAFLTTGNSALRAELKRIDDLEKSGKINKPLADQARQAAYKTFAGYDENQNRVRERENDSQLNDQLKAIQAEYDAKRKSLDSLKTKEDQTADLKDRQEATRLQAELDAQQKRLHEILNQQTSQARHERDLTAPKFDMDHPFDPSAAAAGLGAAARQTVAGTFNTAGAFGLGGGNPVTQIVDATKKTATNTEKATKALVELAQRGGIAFT